MAKTKAGVTSSTSFRKRVKVRRKGVHAKTKTTKNKNGCNYAKPYSAQGK